MAGILQTEIEDLVQCKVCKQQFTDPRILDCFHTFCKSCLNLESNTEDCKACGTCTTTIAAEITCPVCDKETMTPDNGLKGLKCNKFISRVIYEMELSESGIRKSEICGSCDFEHKSTAFCKDCGCTLCKECSEQHGIIKILKQHEVRVFPDIFEKALNDMRYSKELNATSDKIVISLDSCKEKLQTESVLKTRMAFVDRRTAIVMGEIEDAKNKSILTLTEYTEELKTEVKESLKNLDELKSAYKDWSISLDLLQKQRDVLSEAKIDNKLLLYRYLGRQIDTLESSVSQLCEKMEADIPQYTSGICKSFVASSKSKECSIGFFREFVGFLLERGDARSLRKVEKGFTGYCRDSDNDEVVDFAIQCAHSALDQYGSYPSNHLTYSNISRRIADSFRCKYDKQKWMIIVTTQSAIDINCSVNANVRVNFNIDGIEVHICEID